MTDTCSSRRLLHVSRRLNTFIKKLDQLYIHGHFTPDVDCMIWFPFVEDLDTPEQQRAWKDLFSITDVQTSMDDRGVSLVFENLEIITQISQDLRDVIASISKALHGKKVVGMAHMQTHYISGKSIAKVFRQMDSVCKVNADGSCIVTWYNTM